ncbi:MAG: metal ABC transporter permease [Deltaproteobacteria bacterium]|nr:metal ABC transporter permease [Deltaproteobacteria bacterium]
MSEFINALMQHQFLQLSLAGGLLASIGCGVIGTYVVVKRIGYLAGGIAHAILGGMGVAYFFGRDPLYGAIIASIISALIIGWVSLRFKQQEDTIIGALWAIGMSIGVIFIAKTPGYNVDLMGYLFGNILLINPDQLYAMLLLNLSVIALTFMLYKQFLAISFDEEFAKLRGVKVTAIYLLLLCMVAITIVLLIQVVGLVLVIALLTMPAAIAGRFVHSIGKMMILATLLGVLFTTGGIAISYEPNLPTGSTIILLAGITYLFSLLVKNPLTK